MTTRRNACKYRAELVRMLRAALVSFDPGVYSGEDCAVLAEELAAVEKVSAAARVRAAARAGECGAHRERGFGDVSDINNQLLCPPDHRIKTEQDHKAGLLRRRKKPRAPDSAEAA